MSYLALAPFIAPFVSLPSAARTNGTTNGASVDLANIVEMKIDIFIGAYTDGTHALKIQDSQDGSTWVDVPASFIVGGTLTSVGAGSSNTVQSVSYIGVARYVRPVITTTGSTTGAVIGATAQLKRRKH